MLMYVYVCMCVPVCVSKCMCVFSRVFVCTYVGVPEPVAQSIRGSHCGSEGMGFDPHLGQKQSEAIFSVHLNRQDCSGGSEL
jgi:hypothetical protein